MHVRTVPALLFVAVLAACGKPEPASKPAETQSAAPAAAPAPAPAPTTTAATDTADSKGEHVFKTTCSVCHATGAAGAPMFKSKADWEPRIAQGKDTLYTHALKGFTGTKGVMPPKGGNASLSDEDVKAGVDYMVSKVQ
ncbi:MAG TPA: c-type cytochrome [Albitalea sp.]|nr:c-type cytochrome [Albitalea sp.]